jgi:hypothetical protein
METRPRGNLREPSKRTAVAFAKQKNVTAITQRIKKTKSRPLERATKGYKLESPIAGREPVKIGGR